MTMREELEEYASSVDADANTIENFDMGCCDYREVEVLRNVFDWLDDFLKRHDETCDTCVDYVDGVCTDYKGHYCINGTSMEDRYIRRT